MKRVTLAAGVVVSLLVALFAFQRVSAWRTDRDLSEALAAVTAVVPNAWVEQDRDRNGGSGLLALSSRRTHSVTYGGTATGMDLERVLLAAGATVERCEDNSVVVQCYGSVQGRRVGLSVQAGTVTLTVAERP